MRVSRTILFLGMALSVPGRAQTYFSPEERAAVMAYWSESGRYTANVPASAKDGPWAARQTAEGSTWLWTVQRARTNGAKPNPSSAPAPADDRQAIWDAWIESKWQWDAFRAGQEARERNAELAGALKPELPANPPKQPEPIPEDLREKFGDPPLFVAPTQPLEHTVTFDDGVTLTYQDNVRMRPKYAYYRFPSGVMSGGRRLREMDPAHMSSLFQEAGITEAERRVMQAVSLLEGGFDSVNTYDTGFVSVGFIQFACLKAGGGSLGQVLKRLKERRTDAFQQDFRRFGLDVSDQGLLVALDPASGLEFVGPDAAARIIDDKRLIAVFQRAGRACRAFCVSQLEIAKELYYPGEIAITVKVGDRELTGQVKDIFRTEAGMATVMDRLVNTGKLDPLPTLVANFVETYGFETLEELAQAEYQLTRAMIYRKNFLDDVALTRPRDIGLAEARKKSGRGK